MATTNRLFLLGSGARGLHRHGLAVSSVQGRRALVRALNEASPSDLWLATSADAPDELLQEVIRLPHRRHRLGGLLVLHRPRTESIQPLDDFFTPFVWGTENVSYLPLAELAEVLADEERRGDLFIGGYVDAYNRTLTLVRGDLRRLSVPASLFLPSATGERADAFRLQFIDYGNTVRLGDYEAATDAILYEADPDFRRRLLAKRRAEDQNFGACLRRLRLLRGLRQADFGKVTAKTLRRIERGETAAPHGDTLRSVAARLGVAPDEITDY